MKVEIKVPSVGESVNSAIVGSWSKASGDFIQKDEVVVLLETDKASMEVPAQDSGQLEILKKEGEEVLVGEVIGTVDTSKKAPASSPTSKSKPQEVAPVSKSEQPVSKPQPDPVEQKTSSWNPSDHSPSVRHALMKKNIDPSTLKGTGKGERIQMSDLSAPKIPSTSASFSKSVVSDGVETRREKMTTIRKRIAERLLGSQRSTATLTTFNEVDMSRIIKLRKNYQEVFQKKYNMKLGFMGFFIKAIIQGMKAYPRVGAQMEGDELVYYNHCHISIAVSTDKGLIVPVIRYADQKSIAQLEKEVMEYAQKARKGKILPDDLMGGTFTVSNGGVFGSLLSTPILNPPQSGILGMHKIEQRPVVVDGEIVIRPMMYLALSYDHRIVDGKESVGFLVTVKECIEEPTRILLDI